MHEITVIGHGLSADDLTLKQVTRLQSGSRILLHTGRCACAEWLKEHGISFETLDWVYEECEDFDEHDEKVVAALTDAAREDNVIYGVFDVRDRTVNAILSSGVPVKLIAGTSMEASLAALSDDPILSISASEWETAAFSSLHATLIREIDARELAAELKLKLMDTYPDDWMCHVRSGAREMADIPLYALDRLPHYDHTVSALIPAVHDLKQLERFDFSRLCQVIDVLLDPGGCPWDRAQTHKTLRPYMIEEAYEAVGAIDDGDMWHLADELGDVLLQVVLHAGIARRHGEFSITDVTSNIASKMIERHSHIFAGDDARDADAVSDLWNRNKMAERAQKSYVETMLDVPKSFPALLRAIKVLKRWDNGCQASTDRTTALAALNKRIETLNRSADEVNIGEALLALADVARSALIDPEIALNRATDRMIERAADAEVKTALDRLTEEARRQVWANVKLLEG